MRRIIDSDLLTIVVRIVIGGTFIYASFYKIVEPGDFAKSIWFYHIVPGWGINLMALILPWLELLCGLAIILGIFYRAAVALVGAMVVIFVIALSSTILRGIDVDCGCFKVAHAATESAWRSVVMDIGLLILTAQLWFSRSRRWRIG